MQRASPFSLLLGLVLVAVAAPGAVRETVDVRLVTIPLSVTTDEGEPVPGLDRAQLELLRDGQPIEIAALTEASADPLTATSENDKGPLQIVVYLDSAFLEPGSLAAVTPALGRFLNERLHPGDRIVVVAANQGVRLLQPPTGSPAEAVRAIEDANTGLGRGRVTAEYREILRDMEKALGSGGQRIMTVRDALPDLLRDRISALAEEAAREIAVSIHQLKWTVQTVAGLPGRVDLIYVGGRPPVAAARQLYERWVDAFGPNSAYADAGSTDSEGTGAGTGRGQEGFSIGLTSFSALAAPTTAVDVDALLDPLISQAVIDGVRMHTVELSANGVAGDRLASLTGGVLSAGGGAAGPTARMHPELDPRGAALLHDLAVATHGLALSAGRGLDPELARLAASLYGGYRLSFADSGSAAGTLHRLEVRLPGAGSSLRLRHPEVYVSKSPDQEAAAAALTALRLDLTDNPLEVVIHAEPAPGEAAANEIAIAVEVPVSQLALATERRAHSGQISVFATAGSWDGAAMPVRKAVVPIRIANRDLLTALGRRVEYTFSVTLPEGADRIAVGVRDDLALLTSTVAVRLPELLPRSPGL